MSHVVLHQQAIAALSGLIKNQTPCSASIFYTYSETDNENRRDKSLDSEKN